MLVLESQSIAAAADLRCIQSGPIEDPHHTVLLAFIIIITIISISTTLCHITTAIRLRLQTFWHSSAHVLGEALEMEFGVDLTIGPALEEGFYYDCYMGDKVRCTLWAWAWPH